MPGTTDIEEYYALDMPDYVSVLALDGSSRYILVRQYRPATETRTLEFPSGHVSDGETPEEAAKRELLEETGYLASSLEKIGCLIPDTGRTLNRLWCFYAESTEKVSGGEDGIEVVLSSADDLSGLVSSLKMGHALNLALLALAQAKDLITFPARTPVNGAENEE
ncbi:MAG: NUDIX domain-containing protein [Candidatus Omnitrophica bacterium]|nr:NUDIX domain-containing protein [Candidatus Omnitrophota bacterium]